MMFDRVERNVDPGGESELAGLHPAGEHDKLGQDVPLIGVSAEDPAALVDQAGDADAFADDGSGGGGTLGEGDGNLARQHASVVRDPEGSCEVVDADAGKLLLGLRRGDLVAFDPEVRGDAGGAAELDDAILVSGEEQAADLTPSDVVAGELVEACIEIGRVLVDPHHAAGHAEASDHAGGVPAGSAGEAVLFDEQDIAPPELREVPGHGGSGDAAADDENTGAGGEKIAHG